MGVRDAKRLKSREDENRRLKSLVDVHQALYLRQPCLTYSRRYFLVRRPVANVSSLASGFHQMPLSQDLKVLGGIGYIQIAPFGRQFLDCARTLGEQFDQLQPVPIGHGLADSCELAEE